MFKAESIEGLQRRQYKELVNGRAVTLESGRVVQPEECVSEPRPSQCFALFFAPNASYTSSLIHQINDKHGIIQEFSETNINPKMNELASIYHSVSRNVIQNPEYLQAMVQFGPNVTHVLDCEESNHP